MPPINTPAPDTTIKTVETKHSMRPYAIISILVAVVAIALGVFVYQSRAAATKVAGSSTSAPKKIGSANFRQGQSSVEGLKKGLSDLGYNNVAYVEQEIVIGPTMGDDMHTAFTQMIQQDHVDLIFADHEQQAQAALAVTAELGSQTPVVYLARFHDPVEMKLAASYKSSGNNATGVAQNLVDTVAHNLQFVKEISPNTKKIGIFGKGFVIPDVGGRYFDEFKKQAEAQGYKVVEYATDAAPPDAQKEFDKVAASIKPGDIDALFHVPGHFYEAQESAEYALAKKLKIPHSVPVEDMPGGGDFSYSADFRAAGTQAAAIVAKIFQGVKPSDIPVEYGEKSILILNQYRANESGIKFPDSMLYLSDQIISTSTAATTAQ